MVLWDRGMLRADRLPGAAEIFSRHPEAAAPFKAPSPEIDVTLPWRAGSTSVAGCGALNRKASGP